MINFNYILLKNLLFFCEINKIVPIKKKLFRSGFIFKVKFRRNFMENIKYNFIGICISYRNNFISSSIILRNVIELYPVEYIFNIYSPFIIIEIFSKFSYIKYKKYKYYFLRRKVVPLSKFVFNYV